VRNFHAHRRGRAGPALQQRHPSSPSSLWRNEQLVSQSVAESAPPAGVALVELGELQLKGFARPVRLLEARRA
jgi:hypothetical protein